MINQKSYSAQSSVGDIRAVVVEEIIRVDGKDIILELEEQNRLIAARLGQNQGHFYKGNVVYDMQSEPNSLITVHYESVTNNSVSLKIFEEYSKIISKPTKYNSKLLGFDKNGNGILSIDPIFFVRNNDKNEGRRSVYYITLFY